MQNNKNSVTVQKCVFSLFMTLCLPLIAHNSVIDCEHAGMMTLTLAFICWAQSAAHLGILFVFPTVRCWGTLLQFEYLT